MLSNFHRPWSFLTFTIPSLPIETAWTAAKLESEIAFECGCVTINIATCSLESSHEQIALCKVGFFSWLGTRKFKILRQSNIWGSYKAFTFSACFFPQNSSFSIPTPLHGARKAEMNPGESNLTVPLSHDMESTFF